MPNTITLTEAQLDRAEALIAQAIEVGERGTRGDYTEIGILAHIFEVLDIRVTVPSDQS